MLLGISPSLFLSFFLRFSTFFGRLFHFLEGEVHLDLFAGWRLRVYVARKEKGGAFRAGNGIPFFWFGEGGVKGLGYAMDTSSLRCVHMFVSVGRGYEGICCVYVCMCVCVLSPRFTLGPPFSSCKGLSICCVRWSNEAATANADTEADQLDVPAQHRFINRAVLCCPPLLYKDQWLDR